MDRQRTHRNRRERESEDPQPQQPEEASPLLEAARGWAGAAREAVDRLEVDNARDFLDTARRNGPGQ
jgi:hypothetical protein